MHRAIMGGITDVLISRDMPAGTEPTRLDLWDDPAGVGNRHQVRRVIDATRPLLALHGHYHHRHQTELRLADGHPVTVIGLPDAGQWPNHTLVLLIDQISELARRAGR